MVQTVVDHCDFYLLVDKVVDAPVIQVVPCLTTEAGLLVTIHLALCSFPSSGL